MEIPPDPRQDSLPSISAILSKDKLWKKLFSQPRFPKFSHTSLLPKWVTPSYCSLVVLVLYSYNTVYR